MSESLANLAEPQYPLSKEHLKIFLDFLADEYETEMYISGAGGTGKTTLLSHFVRYTAMENIPTLVGAFTHQACKVLRSVLYIDDTGDIATNNVRTVHSFLRKRPGIDETSIDLNNCKVTIKGEVTEPPKVIFFDEYSMIGEDDYMSLGAMSTDEETGKAKVKFIYIGDKMQLPPVGSARTIFPRGDYQIELTKNHRAGGGLHKVLETLRRMGETGKIEKLPDSHNLFRKHDIVAQYLQDMHDRVPDIRMLAYTNTAVDALNDAVHIGLGYSQELTEGDIIHNSTHKVDLRFKPCTPFTTPDDIRLLCNNGDIITPSKDTYNTIPYVIDNFDIMVTEYDGHQVLIPYVFGNMAYKNTEQALREAAIKANIAIMDECKIDKTMLKAHCAANRDMEIVINRNRAWRRFMAFSNNVTLVHRPYASTVHKAQGVSLNNVYIDGNDMLKLYKRDKAEYISLFYTAVSRARKNVYISN